MSMDQAPENNLPPHTDAAHRDPAAGTGLRLGGDAAREIAAYQEHIRQCEEDNTRLRALLDEVIRFCRAEQKAARISLAQGDNVAHWTTRREQAQKILDILKPIV